MKPDRPMFAPDLLDETLQQVFSVRTGERIGYWREGEPLTKEKESAKIKEEKDINQLTLF